MNPLNQFTLVVGVDKKHLRQLSTTLPTWLLNKSELMHVPMIAFYDCTQVTLGEVREVTSLHPNCRIIPWPPKYTKYTGKGEGKFHDPQRYKMLSGFVHVPAAYVRTPYWLKLDTDTVASAGQFDWIPQTWYSDIICHPWGFTKPPEQMLLLDQWVADNSHLSEFSAFGPPLDLRPREGSSRLRHRRIISWCGFFSLELTRLVRDLCRVTCGDGNLPVPSQDGLMWYVARRMGMTIERMNMKALGWEHWSTDRNIRNAANKAMEEWATQ